MLQSIFQTQRGQLNATLNVSRVTYSYVFDLIVGNDDNEMIFQ
jgi:hypothetical protein